MNRAACVLGALGILLAVSVAAAFAADQAAEKNGPVVGGSLVWPGLDEFPAGQVVAARDPRFKDIAAAAPLTEDGHFILPLDPGDYYLMAHVDINADQKTDAPDGLGFYGVEKPQDAPKVLNLPPDAEGAIIEIRIVFQLGESGKLRQATVGPDVGMADLRGGILRGGVVGQAYVVAWPEADGLFGRATPVGDDGFFQMKLPTGRYAIFAVVDENGDSEIEAGEAAGLLAENGKPAPVRPLPGDQVELPPLAVAGKWHGETSIVQDGKVLELPVSSRPAIVQVKLTAADATGEAPWCRLLLFADPKLKSMVGAAWCRPGSWLALRPATYFALCGLDVNGDGRLGPGDKLAAHADDRGSHVAASFRYGQIGDLVFAPATPLTEELLKPRDKDTPQ